MTCPSEGSGGGGVVGVDPSLNGTAIATEAGVHLLDPGKRRGVRRLAWLRDEASVHLVGRRLVVLEGYAYGKGHQAHQIGEWGGVLRLALYDLGVPCLEVPPSTLKQFATGKGNASKEAMLAGAIRRLGYAGHSLDEADALWLREAGLDVLGLSEVKLPATQSHALAGLRVPPLARHGRGR